MKKEVISHGSKRISLKNWFRLMNLEKLKSNEIMDVPAVVEDRMFLFDVERVLDTFASHLNVSSQDLAAGSQLMLEILGSSGLATDLHVEGNRTDFTLSGEVREEILARFAAESTLDRRVAEYILQVVGDGIYRTFRTQLSSSFIRDRLLDIDRQSAVYQWRDFGFAEILQAFEHCESIYSTFLMGSDITVATQRLRSYQSNPILSNVIVLRDVLFHQTGYAVSVRKSLLEEHLFSTLTGQSLIRFTQVPGMPILQELDESDSLIDWSRLDLLSVLAGLRDLIDYWHFGRRMGVEQDVDVQSLEYRFFFPFQEKLNEVDALDRNALLSMLERSQAWDAFEQFFMVVFKQHYVKNILGSEFGTFASELTGLITAKKSQTDFAFEDNFLKHVQALSLIRKSFVDAFATIYSAVHDDFVLFFDVTPVRRPKLLEVFDAYVDRRQTHITTLDSVRFIRAESKLIEPVKMQALSVPKSAELCTQMRMSYDDESLNTFDIHWLVDEELGQKKSYILRGDVNHPKGNNLTNYMRSPIDKIRPILRGWTDKREPFFFEIDQWHNAMHMFQLQRRLLQFLPLAKVKESGFTLLMLELGSQLDIFTSVSEMGLRLKIPTDVLQRYLDRLGAEADGAWLKMGFDGFVLIHANFDFYEIGATSMQDPRDWPFVGLYPVCSLWSDADYIYDDEFVESVRNPQGLAVPNTTTSRLVNEEPVDHTETGMLADPDSREDSDKPAESPVE